MLGIRSAAAAGRPVRPHDHQPSHRPAGALPGGRGQERADALPGGQRDRGRQHPPPRHQGAGCALPVQAGRSL